MEEKVFLDLEGTEYLWSKIQAQDATAIAEHNNSEEAHADIRAAIPTKVSDLTNDSGYLTEHQSLAGYATETYVGTAVSTHNTATDSHNDIRLLVEGLTTRLNTLADSDDTTLDQMSEVVAYIKSNKELIEGVTTNKVNVADIIDNLTTNVSNKPLSAAQGVALKTLIDNLDTDKLDASALTSAINTALAQAKESGEFDGAKGEDGVGISSVRQTTTSIADDGNNIITVTLSNGTTSTFTVQNGSKGSDGAKGDSPVRGTDYWTDADKAEIKSYVDEAILGGAW